MKKLLLAALLALAGCHQMGGPVEMVCDMSRDCQTNDGQCFSCNAGYVCGSDGQGDVTCVTRPEHESRWELYASQCTGGQTFSYSGRHYNACFNTRQAAIKANCTTITDNCHQE
jgi:hypothetical protein